ncbi:MAG: hypothetical protein GXO49_07410, partial [Chlorobi bacterium]|nr:hypothetical protein [Chlorobiota bacterium]
SDATSSSSIANCIIKGGYVGTNITNTNTLLSNDPLFKNVEEMDFSVQPNSIAVDGGYYISDAYGTFDFLGNDRTYNFGNIDIGAYELQAPRLAAIPDIYNLEECEDSRELYFLGYDSEYPYAFEWSVINNDQAYIYFNNYEEKDGNYFVKNLPPSIPVDIKLTVTDGTITEVDTVTIINTQPIVNAGEDISLINTDINNNTYSDVTLSANLPLVGEEKGIWEEISATGLTISDNTINNPTISDIEYGVHEFVWTISKIEDEFCSNKDTLLIVAGHSFTSEPDGTFDWNTPSDWEEGAIPGIADSVTIYGVTGIVGDAGGVCDRLFIGNGATLNIEGTAKAVSNLNCRVLTVEEDSEKFKNIKGSANLYIKDNASLNIGSEYVSKSSSTSGSGLFIGSGGTVFIRPNAEKNAKATAGLNIGSGGFIFIRPNAEKNVKATAGLNIGSGGFVFIRPNAEKKTSKTITTGDVFIGPGGYLNIEQTIDGTTGGYLELANDRTIYVSPSTAKAVGGNFGIYGGTVFIRPNAEKSSSNNYGVYCGRGGTIFIRPNAEKTLAQANLITPGLLIEGGKVIVGTDSKSKAASGRLSFNQIFIRPNAEKDIIADTSLIVYPSGELVLSDSLYTESPYIEIENSAVSFLEGSVINLDNARATAHIYIKPNGSLIDMNPTASYKLLTEYAFEAGKFYLFSPSTQNTFVNNFGDNKMVNIWNETINDWNEMTDADMLNSGNSYLVTYPSDNALKYFYEITNNGDINVPLSFSNTGNIESEGWNTLGNPYPSAIDIEKLNIPTDAFSSFYVYNPDTETIGIYQKGGVSLNNANQYLMQNEGFFIKTDAISNFTFDNNSRVHFTDDAKTTKAVNNLLKLRVSDITNSDETAILFNNDASDYIDKEFDALKLNTGTIDKPILYTKITGENAPIAINTLEYTTEETTIPLYFEAGTSGQYTINVSDLIFDEGVTIKLKDIIANTEQELTSSSSYDFDYTVGEDPHKFDIIISGMVSVDEIANDEEINIFS